MAEAESTHRVAEQTRAAGQTERTAGSAEGGSVKSAEPNDAGEAGGPRQLKPEGR